MDKRNLCIELYVWKFPSLSNAVIKSEKAEAVCSQLGDSISGACTILFSIIFFTYKW